MLKITVLFISFLHNLLNLNGLHVVKLIYYILLSNNQDIFECKHSEKNQKEEFCYLFNI